MSLCPGNDEHAALRIERVFDRCFSGSWRTRLRGGAPEPLYQPATDAAGWHTLHYRLDYPASALHEVAHWCIAGERRRQLVDFGYWYLPPGRDTGQQSGFEQVESRPQALEWYFAKACGQRFSVSADNLELATAGKLDLAPLRNAVLAQAINWQRTSLPERAETFYDALCSEFATQLAATELRFTLAELT